MISQNQIETAIAKEFSEYLKHVLTDKQMKNIIEMNKGENHMSVCHSHHFCDADFHMGEAYRHIMESNTDFRSTIDNGDIEDEIWNNAWGIAFMNDFFIQGKSDE